MKPLQWIAAAGVAAFAAAAFGALADAAAQSTMSRQGCTACHAIDKKLVGPAYKEIAKKYKGDAGAVARLAEKVLKGGPGVWGPVPMPPNAPDKISDADLKSVVEWILTK